MSRQKIYNMAINLLGVMAILVMSYNVNNYNDLQDFIKRLANDWSYLLSFLVAMAGYFSSTDFARDLLSIVTKATKKLPTSGIKKSRKSTKK